MDFFLERTRLILLRFHWVLNLLMITMLSWQTAGILSTIIDWQLPLPALPSAATAGRSGSTTRPSSSTGARSAYDVIVERNIFNSAPKTMAAAETPAATTSDLHNKLRLTGTVVSKKRALATFFIVPKNESEVFRIGDEVYEGWIVDSVERAVVRLRTGNDMYEEIYLHDAEQSERRPGLQARAPSAPGTDDPALPGGPSEGFVKEENDGKFIVDKMELESQLQNLDNLITQARVIPNFSAGKVDGFKIFAIKPNSVFQRLGFRNGDVIESINGTPLDNAQRGLQMFQELRNLPRFEINLRRQNNKRQHSYEVR
ncbi:MAG: hypothetical protein KIT79_08095 [Deltaproteobacteria bacterium]|nr:hypothetical protein [Deltaproteobacteria bacterium]